MNALLIALPAALAGAAAGWALARRQSDRRLARARRVWTTLRAGQVSEFLSYVLYQMREYLISTTSLAEAVALSAPKDDPKLVERIDRLKRVINELNGKASRMLGDKSAVTTQRGQPETLSVAALVRDAAADAQAAFATAPITVSVVEDSAPEVTCDPRTLRLSVLAVLQNSLEACSARGGGKVSIVVRKRERYAEIEILDDGGGSAADPNTLFEPFFAASKGSSGLGLGLPMARRMVERLGGTVRLKSGPGATAVLLEFPITRDLPVVRNEESTWAGRRSSV